MWSDSVMYNSPPQHNVWCRTDGQQVWVWHSKGLSAENRKTSQKKPQNIMWRLNTNTAIFVNNSQSVCCAASPAEWSQFLWGIDSPHSLVPTSPVSKRERGGTSCYCIDFTKSAPLSKTLALLDQLSREPPRQASKTLTEKSNSKREKSDSISTCWPEAQKILSCKIWKHLLRCTYYNSKQYLWDKWWQTSFIPSL